MNKPSMRKDQVINNVDVAAAKQLNGVMEKGARVQWWRRCGDKKHGFWYEQADGHRIKNKKEVDRIHSLAIPPGYSEVRVSPSGRTRLQAIARDTQGRVQYRYNRSFAECQARKKFARAIEFGRMLPRLRHSTNLHLSEEGLCKDHVIAVVLRLINETYFRIGSEGSVQRYKTFGITSLRNYHLAILGDDHLIFQFTGKHHIKQRRILIDADLASELSAIKAIEGKRLFNYLDPEGIAHPVKPNDINRYIKQTMGPQFSAKDFRTWGGTLQAAIALAEMGRADSERAANKNIVRATKAVAERLGNTPAVCRSSYIHPSVFERYREGVTLSDFRPSAQRITRRHHDEYDLEEVELLKLLEIKSGCAN